MPSGVSWIITSNLPVVPVFFPRLLLYVKCLRQLLHFNLLRRMLHFNCLRWLLCFNWLLRQSGSLINPQPDNGKRLASLLPGRRVYRCCWATLLSCLLLHSNRRIPHYVTVGEGAECWLARHRNSGSAVTPLLACVLHSVNTSHCSLLKADSYKWHIQI